MKGVLVYGGTAVVAVLAGGVVCVLLMGLPLTVDLVVWQLIPGALMGMAATLVIGHLVDLWSR